MARPIPTPGVIALLCLLALGSCEDLGEGGDRIDAEATAAWPFIAPTDNREAILDQTELTYVEGRTGELFHSAEVRVRGCSPRAYAHELGHVLGFVEHAQGARALMRAEDVANAWDVSEGELQSLHDALARVP